MNYGTHICRKTQLYVKAATWLRHSGEQIFKETAAVYPKKKLPPGVLKGIILSLFTCLKDVWSHRSNQYTWHAAVAVPCRGALFRSSNRGALWGGEGRGTVRAQPAKKKKKHYPTHLNCVALSLNY